MTLLGDVYYTVYPRLYRPEILWQSPTQQIAMRGETWSVKCIFSGRRVSSLSLSLSLALSVSMVTHCVSLPGDYRQVCLN